MSLKFCTCKNRASKQASGIRKKKKIRFISFDLAILTSQTEAGGFPLGIPSQWEDENQRLGKQESSYLL